MSDPVLALVLIVSFIAALAAASYFKTLDSSLGRDSRIPLIAGAVTGVLIHYIPGPIATGIILTIAALYVRLIGRESEPSDGMTLGAMTGVAAPTATAAVMASMASWRSLSRTWVSANVVP